MTVVIFYYVLYYFRGVKINGTLVTNILRLVVQCNVAIRWRMYF